MCPGFWYLFHPMKIVMTSVNFFIIQYVYDMSLSVPGSKLSIADNLLFTMMFAGTRIIYERAFLMQCRNSPLAKSPPANLPKIPGVTSPDTGAAGDSKENGHPPTIPGNTGVKALWCCVSGILVSF